jgi:hypothetical protein
MLDRSNSESLDPTAKSAHSSLFLLPLLGLLCEENTAKEHHSRTKAEVAVPAITEIPHAEAETNCLSRGKNQICGYGGHLLSKCEGSGQNTIKL